MSKKSTQSSLGTAILSVVVFLPALILFLLSLSIGFRDGGVSHASKVDIFTSYFPDWMNNYTLINIVSIVLCIIAMSLAAKSFKKPLVWERVMVMLVSMGAIVVILYNIVQIVQG